LARGRQLELDSEAIERFETYRRLMIEAAATFNLTNIRDPAAINRRHFLDALTQTALLQDRGLLPVGCRVIDVGSGAGLPGLPMKIARPDLDLSLLDSHAKRCEFLRRVIDALHLEGARVMEGRAEERGREPELREAFDLTVARAVAPLPVLVELTLPFLRIGGHLAATKGAGAERELLEAGRAIEELGGRQPEIVVLDTHGESESRLVLVKKARPTPEHYPRRTGIPAKRPLV
jgi:16S rRNA (guanine527-N7)-methyltransferase